jgi:hypothetical protein
VAGQQSIPVEAAGDQIVAGDQNQLTYGSDHIGRSAVALAASSEGQSELTMDPSDPVNE